MLHREQRGGRSGGDTDPEVDVLHVVLGSPAGDHQPVGDSAVRHALRHQPEHLDLPLREAGRAAAPGAAALAAPLAARLPRRLRRGRRPDLGAQAIGRLRGRERPRCGRPSTEVRNASAAASTRDGIVSWAAVTHGGIRCRRSVRGAGRPGRRPPPGREPGRGRARCGTACRRAWSRSVASACPACPRSGSRCPTRPTSWRYPASRTAGPGPRDRGRRRIRRQFGDPGRVAVQPRALQVDQVAEGAGHLLGSVIVDIRTGSGSASSTPS